MVNQSALRNRLLSRLSPDDFALLANKLTPFTCAHGAIVVEADERLPFVYFLEDGMASIVARSPEGQVAEAGVIGREGFLHPSVILGSDSTPCTIQIQMPGHALRIPLAEFLHAVEQSLTLRRTLTLFAHVNATQASFSTLSNAVHQIPERLARWLLMCHDRSQSDDLDLTHEFIGIMLSVRRPSVTNALHVLEGNGLIRCDRARVMIVDRAALEEYAADAYGKPEAEYRRLLGPL